MKSIGNILKWIWENKEWIFSGIGITILSIAFSMLINKSIVDKTDDSNLSDTFNQDNGSYIEVHGDVNGSIYQNSIDNSSKIEDNDDNKQEIIMSEAKYLEHLQSNVEGNIVFHYYDDYDGDGDCEMFALVGEKVENDGFYEEENMVC